MTEMFTKPQQMLVFNPSFANNVEVFQISNKISEIVEKIFQG
jgi:hypothetical protein